jgi:hypothetical protein
MTSTRSDQMRSELGTKCSVGPCQSNISDGVTASGAAAAVMQRKVTAIVNIGRVIATASYHFIIAVRRTKVAESAWLHNEDQRCFIYRVADRRRITR